MSRRQGNGLRYGMSDHLLTKLQRVQTAAARFITRNKRRDHVTPVLIDLRWLPMKPRIEYKLFMLTFRSRHGLITCRQQVTNTFNEYFVNLGPNLASKIPDENTRYSAYLKGNDEYSVV